MGDLYQESELGVLMVNRCFKQPLFLIGFLYVSLVFLSSVLYMVIYHDKIPTIDLLYRHNRLIGVSPLTPLQKPPLGTDKAGNNVAIALLVGAKYTIGIAIVVALFRTVVSCVLGVFYSQYFIRFQRVLSGLVDSIGVFPMALLAYLLLRPIMFTSIMDGHYQYSFAVRNLFFVLVLIFIAVPQISVHIGNDIQLIMKKEFIAGAQLLGAGRWRILTRHVWPHLFPRILIMFTQQIVQALIILIHLGLFNLFFGGTHFTFSVQYGPEYVSSSFEWSGLIGNYRNQYGLQVTPWLLLSPVAAFTLTMLAFNLITEGIKRTISRYVPIKRIRQKEERQSLSKVLSTNDSFAFIKKNV